MKHDLSEMMCLDIYLSNLSSNKYKEIKQNNEASSINMPPLKSWDIYSEHYGQRLLEIKKKYELNQIISLSKRFNWKNDFDKLLNDIDHDAVIITDIHQKIIWTDDGFSSMTGYSKTFATNKTPRFLQGKKTSKLVKQRIKQKILQNKPFSETILNYRKDKTTYKCEVKIIPLYNTQTTHYMALEKEIV